MPTYTSVRQWWHQCSNFR